MPGHRLLHTACTYSTTRQEVSDQIVERQRLGYSDVSVLAKEAKSIPQDGSRAGCSYAESRYSTQI
jgi:hypothetical protein